MNVRVVYESTPIRHIAVQCPHCGKWFSGWDILAGNGYEDLRFEHDISFATFECPLCEKEFGGLQHNENVDIRKVGDADECYKDCLRQKVTWE